MVEHQLPVIDGYSLGWANRSRRYDAALEALAITVIDHPRRRVQCALCKWLWRPEAKREGSRVRWRGWWTCPAGCNSSAAWLERYAVEIMRLEQDPPWPLPPDLVTAALEGDASPSEDVHPAAVQRRGRPPGSHSFLDPVSWGQRTDTIIAAREAEVPWSVLARQYGVHKSTLQRWVTQREGQLARRPSRD